jgi:hypothetical protein
MTSTMHVGWTDDLHPDTSLNFQRVGHEFIPSRPDDGATDVLRHPPVTASIVSLIFALA